MAVKEISITDNSLLLILPVFLMKRDNQLWLDDQACNGLRLWLENFDKVTVAAVLNPKLQSTEGYSTIESIGSHHRLDVIPLPFSYTPRSFIRDFKLTMKGVDSLIDNHRFLSFAIGGFWGDWGSFACLRAFRKKRAFSVWTDRVEHDIIFLWSQNSRGIKKAYYYLLAKLARELNNRAIKKASLGLFHGNDCFDTYSPLVETSFCVHDVHLSSEFHLSQEEVEEKVARIDLDKPLKILYAGRVDTMKGPEDWVQVMKNLIRNGILIDARWAGEGKLKEKLVLEINTLGLADKIEFVGLISNHNELLDLMRESDLFVFCHKTQESPRCLIEALISGCPLVGYGSSYPLDLVSHYGGGIFAERDNIEELAGIIADIARDRDGRANLIRDAAASGRLYSDSAVFKHRSDLIKKYL